MKDTEKFSIPALLQKIWEALCALSQNIAPSNQANWDESDDGSPSFIKGKPAIANGSGSHSLQQAGEGAMAIGEGSFAEGAGEVLELTLTSNAQAVGDDTYIINFNGMPEGNHAQVGDTIRFGESRSWVANVYAGESVYDHRIAVTPRFSSAPKSGDVVIIERGVAYGLHSHHEGAKNVVRGENAHAEGLFNAAGGDNSHVEGFKTRASGWAAHAEGEETKASESYAHAEGKGNVASGKGAHAEGDSNTASGHSAHAEGLNTKALGEAAHAEGSGCEAKVDFSHAEGFGTEVEAICAHAEGYQTKVDGQNAQASHVEGYGTIVKSIGEHAEGMNNVSHVGDATDPNYMAKTTRHSVGIGTPAVPEYQIPETHKNAFEIMMNGDTYVIGFGGYDGTNAGSAGVLPINQMLPLVVKGIYVDDSATFTCENGLSFNDVKAACLSGRPVIFVGRNADSYPMTAYCMYYNDTDDHVEYIGFLECYNADNVKIASNDWSVSA